MDSGAHEGPGPRQRPVENQFGAPNGAWLVREFLSMMKTIPACGNESLPKQKPKSPQSVEFESSPQLFQGKIEKFIIKTVTQNTMFPFFCALSCATYPQ